VPTEWLPTTSALVSNVAFVGNNGGGAKIPAEATLLIAVVCAEVLRIDAKFDIKRTLASTKIIMSNFFNFSPSLEPNFSSNTI
jgi:hypothetical protein